jgi:hypothetical protein
MIRSPAAINPTCLIRYPRVEIPVLSKYTKLLLELYTGRKESRAKKRMTPQREISPLR